MSLTVTDHREVSERCSIHRAIAEYRGVERLVFWTAECHVCGQEDSFFGDTAKDDATNWAVDHECPIAVQVDESGPGL